MNPATGLSTEIDSGGKAFEEAKTEIVIEASPSNSDNSVLDSADSRNLKLKSDKEIVEEYFQDIPILVDVARCESEFRQLDLNGEVLRGVYNPGDVGVMQINERYHGIDAEKLGYDIYTIEGNMAYARYLYKKFGTSPWDYSSKCWGSVREVTVNE